MDSYYDYIWDVTILEYLTYLHHKRGETDKRQIAIKAIGQTELNASNPEEVLQLAAQRRKKSSSKQWQNFTFKQLVKIF